MAAPFLCSLILLETPDESRKVSASNARFRFTFKVELLFLGARCPHLDTTSSFLLSPSHSSQYFLMMDDGPVGNDAFADASPNGLSLLLRKLALEVTFNLFAT